MNGERTLLQSLILRRDGREKKELFIRGDFSGDGVIRLGAGGKISLDTYFNSFSYTKYRDYTRAGRVTVRFEITGGARLSLCVFDGQKNIIETRDTDGGTAEMSAELSALPQNGFLYPEVETESGCEISKIEYLADALPEDISCCAAICTFKREEYVLKNIEQLKSSGFSFLKRVFVIDNGQTLDSAALSDNFISVLPNKNYGGSGGFTRGLIEAYRAGFSHVIFMDDDIEFYSETLERMTVFISLLKKECENAWFSTAMLRKSDRSVQYEMGAEWKRSYIEQKKHDVDITDNNVLLDNLNNNGFNYAGWWCLCMPVSVVDSQRLPYPFFIKFDDIEYGLRKPPDTPIVTMNGIAVTHDDFENKFSYHLIYYFCRNQLITNSVTYRKGNLKYALLRLVKTCGKQLLLYSYDVVPIILKAFDDYLKGVSFFLSCDEEQLNRELIGMAPKQEPLGRIPENAQKMDGEGGKISILQCVTLGGYLIPCFFLKKEPLYIPAPSNKASVCFRRRTLVRYQLDGDKCLITRRSFGKFLKYAFAAAGMAIRLLFRFSAVDRDFAENKNKINSLEFWEKHLSI